MSENLKNFENLKENKKINIQPCAQPTDLSIIINNILVTNGLDLGFKLWKQKFRIGQK